MASADDAMKKDSDIVAFNIDYLRSLKGMRPVDLAKKSGVPKSLVSKLESGHTNPCLNTLSKIAAALGVRTYRLLQPYD